MNLIEQILTHLFGRKYYINILNMRGTFNLECASFIFTSREEADKHRERVNQNNHSYQVVATISFRSHDKDLEQLQ